MRIGLLSNRISFSSVLPNTLSRAASSFSYKRRSKNRMQSIPSKKTTVDQISLTFLGTAAGKPCKTRNVSSIALRLDGKIWVVDCGEATQHQYMKSNLRMGSISKFFITHCHGDHIFGIVPLLCTMASGDVVPENVDTRAGPAEELTPTEIFGPAGLRLFLRYTLRYSYSGLARSYVVHELLFPGETPETSDDLHPSELRGKNIIQENGVWKDILEESGLKVSAGPILHTVPCLGYVFEELPRTLSLDPSLYLPHLLRNEVALKAQGIMNPRKLLSVLKDTTEPITLPDGTILKPPGMGGPGRKLVILGDTYNADGIIPLAMDADLLIHEATNSYLPNLDLSQSIETKITAQSVLETAAAHGHSTPEVAGAFARTIGAKKLILNHISVKYPSVPSIVAGSVEEPKEALKREMLEEIGRLGSVAWGGKAIVAMDFMEVDIPRKR